LGLHVAEVERDAPRLAGFGVATALAVANLAPPGSLWVTSTVRDLLACSGLALESAGQHVLGAAGQQSVFSAVADVD
jgi:hypothetical protein